MRRLSDACAHHCLAVGPPVFQHHGLNYRISVNAGGDLYDFPVASEVSMGWTINGSVFCDADGKVHASAPVRADRRQPGEVLAKYGT